MLDHLFRLLKVGQLRFNDAPAFEDEIIMQKLKSAIGIVSQYIGFEIIHREIKTYVEFQGGCAIFLPKPNLGRVLINEAFECFADKTGELDLKHTLFIRSLRGNNANPFNSSYLCEWESGFKDISEIPANIIEAILKLSSHLYHYRGDAMNRNAVGGFARSANMINNPMADSGAASLLSGYLTYAR